MNEDKIKEIVKESYSKIAAGENSCCSPVKSCCANAPRAEVISKSIGYSDEEISAVPEGANLGLGCGNPLAHALLKKGDVVLDLGSGAGFDCFLAANKVGEKGRVIGVDMTSEMIEKAKHNAQKGGYNNVEFRLGEIEKLPVSDNSVDMIISNCVINLSPAKDKVFKEAFRVLKPGAKLMLSDMILLNDLPDIVKKSITAYVGCLSGAVMKDKYIEIIKSAGFTDIKILEENKFPVEFMANDPTAQAIVKNAGIPQEGLVQIAESVASVKVSAIKPG